MKKGAQLFALLASTIWFASAADHRECPVKLLNVETGEQAGLSFDKDGLQYLESLPSPLYFVPMLGVYRGGKSLLMCRLSGLKAPYEGGFGIGHTQETFTRGIQFCPERVKGLGTVVWMDTEGLFSSEEARNAYGTKVFNLALLFSSTILLNSVKVLNDKFFSFFEEQQQVARVLKQGLASQGLPQEALLPSNLSVFWVLQQPVKYDSSNEASTVQMNSFLSLDDSRARVQRQFHHLVHEVPVATQDIRNWDKLETLPDDELEHSYVAAASYLRQRVLRELRRARPLQASSVAKQLQTFLQVVEGQDFSGTVAKEAFEQAEVSAICGNFSSKALEDMGVLPTPDFEKSMSSAQQSIEDMRSTAVESFHLDQAWTRQVDSCIGQQIERFKELNAEAILAQWRLAADEVAQSNEWFIQGDLQKLLAALEAKYAETFTSQSYKQAYQYAALLQRSRLGNIRTWDILGPLLLWMMVPFCILHLRSGLFSGIFSLITHLALLVTSYPVLRLLNKLPRCLDASYPILQMHPLFLELALRLPPWVPLQSVVRWLGCIPCVFAVWRLLRPAPAEQCHIGFHKFVSAQPPGTEKASESDLRQRLIADALLSASNLDSGKVRLAATSMFSGLTLAHNLGGCTYSSCRHREIRALLKAFHSASCDSTRCSHFGGLYDHRLYECASSGSLDELLEEMSTILRKILDHADRQSKLKLEQVCSTSASDELDGCEQDDSQGEEPESSEEEQPSEVSEEENSHLEAISDSGSSDCCSREGVDEASQTSEECQSDASGESAASYVESADESTDLSSAEGDADDCSDSPARNVVGHESSDKHEFEGDDSSALKKLLFLTATPFSRLRWGRCHKQCPPAESNQPKASGSDLLSTSSVDGKTHLVQYVVTMDKPLKEAVQWTADDSSAVKQRWSWMSFFMTNLRMTTFVITLAAGTSMLESIAHVL